MIVANWSCVGVKSTVTISTTGSIVSTLMIWVNSETTLPVLSSASLTVATTVWSPLDSGSLDTGASSKVHLPLTAVTSRELTPSTVTVTTSALVSPAITGREGSEGSV